MGFRQSENLRRRPKLMSTCAVRTHALGPRDRRLAVLLIALTAAGLAPAAAQASASARAAVPEVALSLSVTETLGATPRTATQHCRASREVADGYLAEAPMEACKHARTIAGFLLSTREPDGFCTDILKGEQTAAVTGLVNGRSVHRTFSRQGGCAIADWDRMGLLLSSAISPSRLLIAYHRSGGLFAHDDRLSVARSGLAIRTAYGDGPRVFDLSAVDLSDLQRVLEQADFPSLNDIYVPPFVVSDGFAYTLTHDNKTVVTSDGAIPKALEALIEILTRLLDGPVA